MASEDAILKEGRLYAFGTLKSGDGQYCQTTFCVLKGRYFAQYRDEGDEVSQFSFWASNFLRSLQSKGATETSVSFCHSRTCSLNKCYSYRMKLQLSVTLFMQVPAREGVLDGSIRLEDTGRKSIGNQVSCMIHRCRLSISKGNEW